MQKDHRTKPAHRRAETEQGTPFAPILCLTPSRASLRLAGREGGGLSNPHYSHVAKSHALSCLRPPISGFIPFILRKHSKLVRWEADLHSPTMYKPNLPCFFHVFN